MAPGYYSTEQAARRLDPPLTRAALHAWIKKGHVAPPRQKLGRALMWTEADIARLRAAQKKIRERIRLGRPRKKRS